MPAKKKTRTVHHLAVDVGGTRTRALLAAVRGGKASPLWGMEAALSGRAALRRFLEAALRDAAPDRCAVDFAGPVERRGAVRMTNWPGNPVLRLGELEAWGLPAGRTLILNDLEASACGVLALAETPAARARLSPLYRPTRGAAAEGPMVIVAPGTGLGTAAVVGGVPMGSEVQHAAAAPLDRRHARMIAWMERARGRFPSWEDFTSGRGLADAYRALCALDRAPASVLKGAQGDPAGAVARAASTDPRAREALDYYYGCAGRVAQLLALTVQPDGGIFLCGTTTAGNAAFIRKSRFIRELHASEAQGALLRRFPVFMVEADLNLIGGQWACRHPERFFPSRP
jgi:glucokinase